MPKLDKVQFKRSDVVNKKPTAEQLEYGEMAINYAKGSEAIFFKNNENNITEIKPVKVGEDLQFSESNGELQFADRGLNDNRTRETKYLRVQSNGILTQAMVKSDHPVTFIIRSNFNLDGAKITLPKDSVLQFEGGVLRNGTLVGDNTCIKASSEQIFDISSNKLTITGTWSLPFGALPEWFGAVAYKDANYKGEYVMASSFPPTIDQLPDSSDAINAALSLSSIAGCTCRLQGGQYVIKKTVTIPDSGQLDLCANTIIIPIMQGSGLNADGEYSYAQNFDKYLPTSSYAIALSANSCYTRITGGGRIALGKSKNTIGLYVRGKGYYYTDMIFAPTFDIKIIGGDSPNIYAVNIDALKGDIDPTSEVGVDNDTYLNTKTMLIWFKQKGTWKQTYNGDTRYNVCCRIEMVNPDERMANTRFKLWCINTYRGIEIICLAKNAWTNSITYEGNASSADELIKQLQQAAVSPDGVIPSRWSNRYAPEQNGLSVVILN